MVMSNGILRRNMDQALLSAAGIRWMSATTADEVVFGFRAARCRLMAIDGFMGSGKSPFGSMMEARLARRCIRVDSYLPSNPPADQPSLIERLNLSALYSDLQSSLNEGPAIIEGVLMRGVLDRLDSVGQADVFHVYVAGAWKPDEARVTWPDASQLGSEQGYEPYRQIVEYHRSRVPHEAFDVAVLRDQDEPAASGTFVAPDGQAFLIPETVWPRQHLDKLRAQRFAFNCATTDAVNEPIGLIRPPVLGPATRYLNDNRLRDVLNAIRSNAALPPVVVVREPGDPFGTLLDGAHRYFGSVIAGFTLVPAIHVSKEDAEISYG
jgi:hypothetical protein